MPQRTRSTKKSALIGAMRALLIALFLCLLYRDDINLDVAGLPQHYWEIPVEEARLLGLKLLILTPLVSLLGAITGIVIDRLRDSASNRYYRAVMAIFMPFLFCCAIGKCILAISFSHPDLVFTKAAWQHGLINERFYMVKDLTKNRKLIGMSVKDVKELLGDSEPDAYPWKKESEDECLAYDLGHRSTKYGACLALYYRDDRITQSEITFYKYW